MSQVEAFNRKVDDKIRGRNALLAAVRNSYKIVLSKQENENFIKGFIDMATLYGYSDRIVE